MLNMKAYTFLVFIVLGGKEKAARGQKTRKWHFPLCWISITSSHILWHARQHDICSFHTFFRTKILWHISELISCDMRDNIISLVVAHSYISHSQPIFSILYILASTCHNLNFNIVLNLVCTANCKQEFVIKSPKNIWLEAVGEISGEGKLMRRLHRCQTSDPHCEGTGSDDILPR